LINLDVSCEQTIESNENCLKDYFIPPEATQVSPLIPFSPMPGGALTSNTQMMRDNGILDKFPKVIKAMQEVVVKGGFGTSVTPVSQFYWQQAYANVMFGPWKQIAPGYGKMVLGYFGKTPVPADLEIIKLASQKLKLEPTSKNPLDLADIDPNKKIDTWKQRLKEEGLEVTEENIFIAAACDEKGIAFLKGKAPLNIRKKEKINCDNKKEKNKIANKSYTVRVDGQKFNVTVADSVVDNIQVLQTVVQQTPTQNIQTQIESSLAIYNGTEVLAAVNGTIWKILVKKGDKVKQDQQIMILEAMKMEINITASVSGTISKILVEPTMNVEEGQTLAVIA